MITLWRFTNNQSVTYDFNQDFNPFADFDINVDDDVDVSRQIPQAHGLYPTPFMRRGMTITTEGELLATSSSDYVAKRKTMVAALFGSNFAGLVSENQLGVLRVGFSGEAEDWECTIGKIVFSAPKTWTELAYSPYMITWLSWLPYFTGHTTPANKYRWA